MWAGILLQKNITMPLIYMFLSLTNLLTILPLPIFCVIPGRLSSRGCRVTFAMDELDGKPDNAVRHARLHLPCTNGNCQFTSDDVSVMLSERMQRKCLQRKLAETGEGSAALHRLRRNANRTATTESFADGWNALDITESMRDIHPCDTRKAEMFLSGPAMDNVDCSSVVFLMTTTQMSPLATPHGNFSTLTHAEMDAIAEHASQQAESQRRTRRDASLSPCACQLRACNISFYRLDWLFVAFPKFLDIKTCRGDCIPLTQFPSDTNKDFPTVTNNVVIRNWYRRKMEKESGRQVSPPHCVPIRYEAATIGYQLKDHASYEPHTIKVEQLPNIKANKCGCR